MTLELNQNQTIALLNLLHIPCKEIKLSEYNNSENLIIKINNKIAKILNLDFANLNQPCIVNFDNFIMVYIPADFSNKYISIGPISIHTAENQIKKQLHDIFLDFDLNIQQLPYFLTQFQNAPLLTKKEIRNIIYTILDSKQRIIYKNVHLTKKWVEDQIQNSNQFIDHNDNSISFIEKEIFNLIFYGKVEEIEKLWHHPENNPKLKESFVDYNLNYKEIVKSALMVSEMIALQAGISNQKVKNITHKYIPIPNISDIQTLANLLRQIFSEFALQVKLNKNIRSQSLTVTKTIDYIMDNINFKLSTHQIAKFLGLSDQYLSRHFKQETGKTITSFIHEVKTNQAKYLLHTSSKPITDIAFELGFSSQNYFEKVFKQETNYTPQKFRQIMQ
ncbi:AraC family transcriptional regulator [uncultured Lactobacillus sp.]|uniref:helix-turn-helix domain-containing protein n=1 Tax=uncultured Lactobacillus sp. TaxID=153152 RepID=UPI002805C308|nr:AraC family transcriptional regulator [uncultured Lactobacillus sp.]